MKIASTAQMEPPTTTRNFPLQIVRAITQGEKMYFMSTPQGVAPNNDYHELELSGVVQQDYPLQFTYRCLDTAALQQIWSTLQAVARYDDDMAAYRATNPQ